MKIHSFAFYNGHLSEDYKLRAALERKLKLLENIAPVHTPSATTPKTSTWPIGYLEHKPTMSELNQRRETGHDGTKNISQVAAAIESGEPLDLDQIQVTPSPPRRFDVRIQ